MLSLDIEQRYVHQTYRNIWHQFDQTRYRIWTSTRDQITDLFRLLSSAKELKILELGCGNGRNLIWINKINHSINKPVKLIAIEPCPELYQVLLKKAQFEKVLNLGHFAPQLNEFKGQIDLVLSIAVIHHFVNQARRIQAIQELVDLAKKGGYILIQVMALHRERAMIGWQDLGNGDFLMPWLRTGDLRYYHLFVEGELEKLLQSVKEIRLVKSFQDRSNYGVILQRL